MIAAPRTPVRTASAIAASMTDSISAAGIAAPAGGGFATSTPTEGANAQCASQMRATSAASAARAETPSDASPGERKRGKCAVPSPMTGMPRESSASTVAGRSRMLFAPALITATGVRASIARSALTSGRSVHPRCTPPMPPVANTRMPAAPHAASVAATVVPPLARCAAAAPRSRVLSLRAAVSPPRRTSSSRVSPTCRRPSSMPTVAGTAPAARTVDSSSTLSARFAGSDASQPSMPAGAGMGARGSPCVSTAVSRATTARPSRTAASTSGATRNAGFTSGAPAIRQPRRVRTTPPSRFMGSADGTTPPGNAFGSAALAAEGGDALAVSRLRLDASSSRRRFSASR